MSKVCSNNRAAISSDILSKVNDIDLKNNATDYLETLKLVISVALDKVQRDCCTISEATEIWIEILNHFKLQQNFKESDFKCVLQRFKMAITSTHYLANLLDHRFRGLQLREEQLDEAMEYVKSYHPAAMSDVMSYRAQTSPFKNYLFPGESNESMKTVKPIT